MRTGVKKESHLEVVLFFSNSLVSIQIGGWDQKGLSQTERLTLRIPPSRDADAGRDLFGGEVTRVVTIRVSKHSFKVRFWNFNFSLLFLPYTF